MAKKFPPVSIVVPAYRIEYYVLNFVENINKINYPNFEVIVVFDPAKDKGIEIIKQKTKKDKKWKIFVNKNHLGISKSLNFGIKKAKGEYIVFFMTDMLIDQNCLSELVNFIEKSADQVGAVVAKTYDLHKRDRIQAYRMYLMPQTGFLYIPEYGLKDKKEYNKPFEGYTGIDGGLFKKKVFEKVGLFDLDIDLSINDLDMTWRIWLGGFRIIRVPAAKVYHWSLKEGRGDEKWEFTYAKTLSLFIQNYSLKYLCIYLPQLIIIYSARAIITFLQGNPDPLKGWIRAIVWSVFHLSKTLKKRKNIQGNIRVVSDEYLHQKIFAKLSFWDFYKHVKRLQRKITPIMLNKESSNEKILTYTK